MTTTLTDADLDRIADAVPVDQIGVHITTWHRRFARAVLAAQPAPVPVPLTAIQILGGLMDAGVPDRFFHAFTAGARFAERKHGIAASPEVPGHE
jgi:hypothetical protein